MAIGVHHNPRFSRKARLLFSGFLLSPLVLALSACAGTYETSARSGSMAVGGSATIAGEENWDAELEEIRSSIARRRDGIRSLRGRGYLAISSPDWEGPSQVNTIVLARQPADLRMRGLSPFSTVFDVLSDDTRFTLFFPSEDEVWTGAPEDLGPLTGLPIIPRDVVAAIFATPLVEAENLQMIGTDDNSHVVTWNLPSGERVEARFSKDRVLPKEFLLYEGAKIRVKLSYSDYLLEGEEWWPREVTLRWPELQTRMRITFLEIKLNPEFRPGSFEFDAPEGVRWIQVEGEEEAE